MGLSRNHRRREDEMNGYTHLVKGIDPVADAFSGTVYTDVYNLKNHHRIEFYIYKGVGATGTSTITVEACDDTTPSTTDAIPFHYQEIASGDTHGDMTAATAAGFTTTAGSSGLIKVVVESQALTNGYGYVRLAAVEVVNSPVVGCIMAALIEPRFDQDVQDTTLT